jgi:hypothetical protein
LEFESNLVDFETIVVRARCRLQSKKRLVEHRCALSKHLDLVVKAAASVCAAGSPRLDVVIEAATSVGAAGSPRRASRFDAGPVVLCAKVVV